MESETITVKIARGRGFNAGSSRQEDAQEPHTYRSLSPPTPQQMRRSPRKHRAALPMSPEFERYDQLIGESPRRSSRGAEALISRDHAASEVVQRLSLSPRPGAAELGSPIHEDSARISLFDAIYQNTDALKQKIFTSGLDLDPPHKYLPIALPHKQEGVHSINIPRQGDSQSACS